jgi:transcriptional regulator with GAF, ATPase, and Fis domain
MVMKLFGRAITSEIETLPLELQNACRSTILEMEQLSTQPISIDQFCTSLVESIHGIFSLYSANLFAVDTQNRWLILKVGTSELARATQRRGHRLPFDNNSLVGRVAKTNQGIAALIKKLDQIQYESAIYPPVHSELAMPIILPQTGTTVGVLDIQSERYDAFGKDDFTAFSIIAACIAHVLVEAFPNEQFL